MRVKVLDGHILDDNTKVYRPGQELEVAAEEGGNLIDQGIVARVTTESAGDIVDAIATLDTDDKSLWTEKGLPLTEVIAERVGRPVTAAERTEAWEQVQEQS